MNQIKSYFSLYLKIMIRDKVTLFFTIVLPLAFALMYGPRGTIEPNEFLPFLSMFWVFIVMSTYINGVGLQLARMREFGLMKTYIMISGNKRAFILAIILTQLLLATSSLIIFTTVVTTIYGYFSLTMLLIPILLIIVSIPFAIASTAIALVPVKVSSVTSFSNILIIPLFLLAKELPIHFLSYINPFFTLEQSALGIINALIDYDFKFHLIFTIMASSIFMIIGVLSLKKLDVISLITR